jgi:hypothetical protein
MNQFLTLLIFGLSLLGLLDPINGQNAQSIVDLAITTHGGDRYTNASYQYDFRKHRYTYIYNDGDYHYERFNQSDQIKDVLSNEGFTRYIKGKKVTLPVKEVQKHSGTVNSIHYFAFLPFFLNDPAVNKAYIGTSTINDQDYHKIQVTFDQVGGGVDHEDVYVYWINQQSHTVDFLAYSFRVNGGGVRFRSAYNRRNVGGIIFQDYINFKHDKNTPVSDLDTLYVSKKLIELSRIELKNIQVLLK